MNYPIDENMLEGTQIPGLGDIYMQHFGYITDGYFVEFGAFDGYHWSNTYPLAQIGWSGLLVEPHPEYYLQCKARYADNPRIEVVRFAVGRESCVTELYIGGSISTIKKEMIAIYNDLDWSKIAGLDEQKSIRVAMTTLDILLDGHNVLPGFELLVIDVEGAEIDVLDGFSILEWQPQMCIVEAHEKYPDKRLNAKARHINRYFKTVGYRKIHADTINSIYVR